MEVVVCECKIFGVIVKDKINIRQGARKKIHMTFTCKVQTHSSTCR